MKRREFLMSGALAGVAAGALAAAGSSASASTLIEPDGLNPPGIRMAGIKMLPVMGGKYKVWTKRLGHGPVKVLLLHGGPGGAHDYLEAMESFLPEAGIEMYYYDQLGSGNSDRPDDVSLWNLPRFVEELEEVRQGLGLENFVLYGHSWGGILAIEYALRHQQHLRGLVISNMAAGIEAYLKRTNALRKLLSPEKQAQLSDLEARKDYDNPAYEAIMSEDLYPQILCRTKPWPEPLVRQFRVWNDQVYNTMQGKSEFEVTGNLRSWERWDRLHEIKTRTLTIGGRYDEMDPEDMKKMATMMPNARSAICENGSHMSFWDDQEAYFHHLLGFLKTV